MDLYPLEEGSHLHKQSQLRVLQSDLPQESSDLKEECKEFVNSMYIKCIAILSSTPLTLDPSELKIFAFLCRN